MTHSGIITWRFSSSLFCHREFWKHSLPLNFLWLKSLRKIWQVEKGGLWDHLYMKTCFAPELGVLCNKTQGYVKHFAPAFQKNLFQVLLTCIRLKSIEGCRSIVKGNHKAFSRTFEKIFSGALDSFHSSCLQYKKRTFSFEKKVKRNQV